MDRVNPNTDIVSKDGTLLKTTWYMLFNSFQSSFLQLLFSKIYELIYDPDLLRIESVPSDYLEYFHVPAIS